jgi:hypothetical protein
MFYSLGARFSCVVVAGIHKFVIYKIRTYLHSDASTDVFEIKINPFRSLIKIIRMNCTIMTLTGAFHTRGVTIFQKN